VADVGVGAGIDHPVVALGLDADAGLEMAVDSLRPAAAGKADDKQHIAADDPDAGGGGPVETAVIEPGYRQDGGEGREHNGQQHAIPGAGPLPRQAGAGDEDFRVEAPQDGDRDEDQQQKDQHESLSVRPGQGARRPEEQDGHHHQRHGERGEGTEQFAMLPVHGQSPIDSFTTACCQSLKRSGGRR